MVKKIYNRILARMYWFYDKIIKEADDSMKFYYMAFAFSMSIVFFIWGIMLFIERKTHFSPFEGKARFLIPGILVLATSLISFYRNRKTIEKRVRKIKLSFNYYDVGVVIYIILAFFTFFYNLVRMRYS